MASISAVARLQPVYNSWRHCNSCFVAFIAQVLILVAVHVRSSCQGHLKKSKLLVVSCRKCSDISGPVTLFLPNSNNFLPWYSSPRDAIIAGAVTTIAGAVTTIYGGNDFNFCVHFQLGL